MTDTLPHPYPTPITDDQLAALTAGLNPQRVSSRSQGGRSLSYLEAWDVKATLIRMFGFGGFSAEAEDCQIVQIESNVPKTTGWGENKREIPIEYGTDGQIKFGTANFRVTAMVKVKLTIHQTGAVYTEFAASSQTGPDLGEVSDFAIKTAESDALKRAAIYLGTQFGLSLYDNGSTNDVVRVVLAPDQVWPLARREQLEARDAAKQLNAVVEGRGPVHANGPVITPQGTSLTPEMQAQTQQLIDRGLRMKAEQEGQDPEQFARAAAEAAQAPGVPVALDPSLDEGFAEQHADAAP
jgi:Rad52/22 family double-strand break repair protein